MMALSPGRNDRSKTRWIPWLGAIIGFAFGLGQFADTVGERARGVHNDFGRSAKCLLPAFEIAGDHAVDEPVAALGESGDWRVVQERRALIARRLLPD